MSKKFALVFLKLAGANNLNQKSLNEALPAVKNDNLFLMIGTSTIIRLDTGPIPPSNLNFSRLGSIILISKTEAVLPP